MNQLQKDIQVALSWASFVPFGKYCHHDSEAFKRLEWYMNRDTDMVVDHSIRVRDVELSLDEVKSLIKGFDDLLSSEYDSNIMEYLEREDCD